jgi:hypothetical protein
MTEELEAHGCDTIFGRSASSMPSTCEFAAVLVAFVPVETDCADWEA